MNAEVWCDKNGFNRFVFRYEEYNVSLCTEKIKAALKKTHTFYKTSDPLDNLDIPISFKSP